MKHLLRSLVMPVLLSLVLTACSAEPEPPTAATTAAPETEPAPAELVICANGKSDFTIIRKEEDTDYYSTTAAAFRPKLESLLGVSFTISTDWQNRKSPTPPDKHEILVGETNREESLALKDSLPEHGYIIRVTEHKIAVMGSGKAYTTDALYRLCDLLTSPEYNQNGRVALPIGLEIRHEGETEQGLDLAAALKSGAKVMGSIEKVFNYPKKDGFTAAQGAATDGTYVYIIMKQKQDSGTEVDRVVKIDMANWTVVKESETLPLDHANDMTYDPIRKRLIVTNMLDNIISIIDPETLAITETKKLPFGTYSVGFNPSTKRFVFNAYGSLGGIAITDENFNVLNQPVPRRADAPGYVGQGMDADAEYIYIPLSPDTGTKDNIIQVYDREGIYLGNVSIPTTHEIETLFNIDGRYYAHFNQSGSTIYTLEFYVKFE